MAELDLRSTRVNIEQNVHDLYLSLVSRSEKQAEDRPFSSMKDLFVLAACLGAREGRFKELGPSRDIFSGQLFDSTTEIPVLAALAYFRTEDLSVLSEPKRVVKIAEEWANAGIETVRQELLEQPGRPLWNLVAMILEMPGTTR